MVMSQLDMLVPEGLRVRAGGESLHLVPLKIGQLPAMLRLLSPLVRHVNGSPSVDWLELLGQWGDDILNALVIAVGKPREWVERLSADEAILLAAKVVEVNADFFTRTVMPKLDATLTQVIQSVETGLKTATIKQEGLGTTPTTGSNSPNI
jgi:hypothetical protein